MAEPLLDRLLRPRVVFGTLAAVVLVASLLLPDDGSDDASGTLSSLSYDRSGVRGWYEGSAKLGWRVSRREERFHGALSDSAVYVVVGPEIDPTPAEVGLLLGAVRRGAGLIVSADHHTALGDSLHLYTDNVQYSGYPVVGGSIPTPRAGADVVAAADTVATVDSASAGNEDDEDDEPPAPIIGTAEDPLSVATESAKARRDSIMRQARRTEIPTTVAAYSYRIRAALTATRPLPRDTSAFVTVMAIAAIAPVVKPAVLGLPLGAGRVVVLADPGILRNGTVQDHDLYVLPQRLLEWAAPAAGARVVFDEYHHGLGRHGSMERAVRHALTRTTVGRAALQLMAAGFVLLLAIGARPIPPRARLRLERRSPLEHVGALSRAYMQKGATRLAARRLVHGLRRRHGAAARSGDDETFLRRLAERHPTLRPSVERLVAATQHPTSPRDFTLLADDIDTIERTLRT